MFTFSAVAADKQTKKAFKQFYGNISNMELEIAGTGHGHTRVDLPGLEGQTAWCFGGIPMYDKKSQLLVGYANDCFIGVAADEVGGLSVNPGLTFLDFFAPNGEVYTVTVSGPITAQPVTVPTQSAWGLNVTHITGASSKVEQGNNTCVGGSGPFDELSCVSRISGMVDMSNLNPENIEGSTIGFSCFFSIENIKLQRWAVNNAAKGL